MVTTQGHPEDSGIQQPERLGLERTEPLYIECRDLFKIYKRAELEVVALRGLDLEVESGELIAIIGASGSGKSTLMNVLAGLDRPSAGQVRVGSRDLLDISDSELVMYRRLDVGFVWQATGRNLVSYLNVVDNIELPMAMAGTSTSERRNWSTELLSSLGLGDKGGHVSLQRRGSGRHLGSVPTFSANRPKLLLADEPTGELDTQTAGEVFEMLRELNRTFGVTVVMVTHYPGVAHFVDRVVNIRDGRISSESYSSPTFQRQGDRVEEEYQVVYLAGRLQLPQEMTEQFGVGGLAKAGLEDGTITIKPVGDRPRPSRGNYRRETPAS